jgi:hypothetical protein
MSFDPALDLMMRTSFTTKVLDYCSAGRPIVMWGPSFCSPIRLLRRHEAALTVESNDAREVVAGLERLDSEPELANRLALAASRLAETELSHDHIHGVLVEQLTRLVGSGGSRP